MKTSYKILGGILVLFVVILIIQIFNLPGSKNIFSFFSRSNSAITASAYNPTNESPTPVFNTLIPDQGFVLKDNTNYKFYYAGNDFASINLAQSSDGVNWTPYVGNPIISDAQYHANVKFYSDGFIGANIGTNVSTSTMYYRMWYQGASGYTIAGFRYAESPDGITWYNRTPVTQFGTPVHSANVGINYGIADAVYTPGAPNTGTDWTFRMYVNVQWELAPYQDGRELVVMAFSANGYDWTGYDPDSVGYATPVFAPTLNMSDFDGGHIGWFKVIKNSDTDWEAFYSGGTDSTFQNLNGIGYAVSVDGINWTRVKSLFTTNDGVAWRAKSVWMPSVVKTGASTYKIWFLGSDNADIGSSDWIQWKLGGADLEKDVTPPTVTSVDPASNSVGISLGRSVVVNFNEAMNINTISTSTFTFKKGAVLIPGIVSYSGQKATFVPDVRLEAKSVYTATITTGVTDSSGNALAADYVWNFTTGEDYHNWTDQGINYTAPSGDAYYPSAIYDANGFGTSSPKYKMWYSDGAGGSFLVTSTDGVSWSAPTALTGVNNSHHVQVLYNANCFGTVPCSATTTKYKIWFWDIAAPTIYSISSVATAESADGVNWVNKTTVTQNSGAKLVQNPDSGIGWNRGTYGPVNLFYQPNAANTGTEPWNYKYVMYYNGTDGSHEDTGLAYSTDGINWSAYTANPVLSGTHTGGSEAWDCGSATYGTVLKDSFGYHYFYSGRGEDDGAGGCTFPASFTGIGYASSVDGKTWVKDTKSIFKISDGVSYRSGRIYTPSIIDDGSGFLKMYFSVKDSSGGLKKIGYATIMKPVAPNTGKGSSITWYAINYVASANGAILGNVNQVIAEGQSGTEVTAIPDAGHTFINWSDGLTTPNRTDVFPNQNLTLTAYFSPEPGQEIGGSIDTPTVGTTTGTTTSSIDNIETLNEIIKVLTQETPVVPAESVCEMDIKKYIKLGMINDPAEVIKLKTFLRDHEGEVDLSINGKYDEEAYEAVIRFQERYAKDILAPWGLKHGSGWVYETTIKKINELMCGGSEEVAPVLVVALVEPTPPACGLDITKYIKLGMVNDPAEVIKLKTFLRDHEGETGLVINGIYNIATVEAVIKFQEKYAAEILTPWNLKRGTGYVYKTTSKKINELMCTEGEYISVTTPTSEGEVGESVTTTPNNTEVVATPNAPKTKNTFPRNLGLRDEGEDVKILQKFLNNWGFIVSVSGPGSPGQESTVFAGRTKSALIKFQEANFDALLKPNNLKKGTGYFGETTRGYVNTLLSY